MQVFNRYLVYPEGESQETEGDLSINQLVGINGEVLRPPLPSARMIAYRVCKIRRQELRGETNVYYHLELVPALELIPYVG